MFTGWDVSGYTGSVTVQNQFKQATIKAGTYGNITFAPVWEAIPYTVTIETSNGILSVSGQGTYIYQQSVTVSVVTLKAFFVFDYWENAGQSQSNSSTYTFSMPAENLTLKAWAKIEVPSGLTVTTSGNAATVNRYSSPSDSVTRLVIPQTIDVDKNNQAVNGYTYTIVAIGANAFNGNADLEEIIVPETVQSIGSYAFNNCENLNYIELRSTELTVGAYAFGTSTDDADLEKTLLISSATIVESVVKSSLYVNPNAGLSDYGNLLVGVGKLYVESSITTLSDFIKSAYACDGSVENINDIDYYLYRRTRTTQALTTRPRREDDLTDDEIEEILY
jgi:hypothetical protein